jgi:flavin-dependent dehydrogenase
MRDSYDCITIGAGPGGGTVAALVAEAGFDTLLVEREKVPRFHVGESLMPETYDTFKRLGIWDKLQQSSFVKKYSVQFVGGSGRESQPFFFHEHNPHERSQTFQVERAQFDKLLYDNAAVKGADCFDQTRVLEVLFGCRLLRSNARP